jgi:hypothetical protein
MSKRFPGRPLDAISANRKHVSRGIRDRVELLMRLNQGASVKLLYVENGISLSTIYDFKKQKDKLLKFYCDSDVPNLMVARKTLHQAKNTLVDKVLVEWI